MSVGDVTVPVEASPQDYADRLTSFFDRNLETHRRIEAVGIETRVPPVERTTEFEGEADRFTEELAARSEVTDRLDCGFDAVAVFVADVGEDNPDLDTDLTTPYGRGPIGTVTNGKSPVAYARDGPARSDVNIDGRSSGQDILNHEVCHLYGAEHEKAENLSSSVCSEAGLDQCYSVMGYDELSTCDGSDTRGEPNYAVIGTCNRGVIQETLQTVTSSDDPDGLAGATLSVDGSTSIVTGSEVTFRFGKEHEDVAVSSWHLDFADYEDEYREQYASTGGTGSLPVYTGGDADGGDTATYTYTEPGTYTAELIVTSECDRESTCMVELEVASEVELGHAGARLEVDGSTSVVRGSEVTFRLGKEHEDVAVSSWHLDFADYEDEYREQYASTGGMGPLPVYTGGPDGGQVASYPYPETGTYTADLTVTSEQDEESTSQVEVVVRDNSPPDAVVAPRTTTISPGDEVTFDAGGSTDPDRTGGLQYEWRVDGSEWTDGEATFAHSFDAPGEFDVAVRVSDDVGNNDTATARVVVSAEGPNVALDIYRCRAEGDVDLTDGNCDDREPTNRYYSDSRDHRDDEPLVYDSTPSTHPNKQGFERYEWSIEALFEAEDHFEFAPDHQDEQILALVPNDFRQYFPNGSYLDGLVPGRYEVTLTIEDGNGATGTASTAIIVEPYLWLRFQQRAEVAVGEEVSPTLGWFGPIDRQEWNVERINPWPTEELPDTDGWGADPTEEPSFAFEEPGTYRLSVTHTYPDHDFAVRDTATIEAVDPDPSGGPSASVSAGQTTITPGDSVAVDASESNVASGEATYEWSVENASTEDPVVASPSGVEDEVTLHQLGTHEVSVTVTDESGASDADATEVVVTREPEDGGPVARIDQEPLSPWIDETVGFDGRRSYSAAGLERYEWQIRRQTFEEVRQRHTGARVTTSFDEGHVFDVELTVTDADGDTDSTTETAFAYDHPQTNAGRFDVSPEVPHVGDEVRFDASDSFSPDGIDEIVWEVGNARFDRGVTGTRTFDEPGTYTVYLRTRDTDADGFLEFENVAERDVVVAPTNPPQPDISLSSTEVSPGDDLTLDASGSSDDQTIDAYQWTVRRADATDGQVLSPTGKTVTFSWPDLAGTFEVEVTVTDVSDRTATATRTLTASKTSGQSTCGGQSVNATTMVDGRTVCDVNGDELFRDIDGNGDVSHADVQEFFSVQHRPAWKQPERFDFNGNSVIGHGDVVALFEHVATGSL